MQVVDFRLEVYQQVERPLMKNDKYKTNDKYVSDMIF